MKRTFLFVLVLVAIFLTGCQNNSSISNEKEINPKDYESFLKTKPVITDSDESFEEFANRQDIIREKEYEDFINP